MGFCTSPGLPDGAGGEDGILGLGMGGQKVSGDRLHPNPEPSLSWVAPLGDGLSQAFVCACRHLRVPDVCTGVLCWAYACSIPAILASQPFQRSTQSCLRPFAMLLLKVPPDSQPPLAPLSC